VHPDANGNLLRHAAVTVGRVGAEQDASMREFD
jgi:hypothetical protein